MSTLQNGSVYTIVSSRKGKFAGRLIRHDDTWATFQITSGKAGAMLEYNERFEGEEVTVRRSLCTFTEHPAPTVQHLPSDDTEGGAL